MKTIELKFNGYYLYDNISSEMEKKSAIYCIYTGSYDANQKVHENLELIYIGESGKLANRHENHEKYSDFKNLLASRKIDNKALSFSYSLIDNENRERAECALIFKHKPPLNDKCKKSFNYPTTSIITTGKNYHLKSKFTEYGKNDNINDFLDSLNSI